MKIFRGYWVLALLMYGASGYSWYKTIFLAWLSVTPNPHNEEYRQLALQWMVYSWIVLAIAVVMTIAGIWMHWKKKQK